MQTNKYRIGCFQTQLNPKFVINIKTKLTNHLYKDHLSLLQAFAPSLFMTEWVQTGEISNELSWRISSSCWCMASCPVYNHLNSLLPRLTHYMLLCPMMVNMLNPTLVWVQISKEHVAISPYLHWFLSSASNYTGWSLGILLYAWKAAIF